MLRSSSWLNDTPLWRTAGNSFTGIEIIPKTPILPHLVARRGFGFGERGSAAADFGDDFVGGLLPDEGFGIVVPMLGPQLDRFDEDVDTGERATS
jgi:hypothetical protein